MGSPGYRRITSSGFEMFGCKMPEIPSYSNLKRRVPVKTGMIVIAVLQILIETGLLIGGLYQLFAYSKELWIKKKNPVEYIQFYMWCMISSYIIHIPTNVILIIGAMKKKRQFIKFWLAIYDSSITLIGIGGVSYAFYYGQYDHSLTRPVVAFCLSFLGAAFLPGWYYVQEVFDYHRDYQRLGQPRRGE